MKNQFIVLIEYNRMQIVQNNPTLKGQSEPSETSLLHSKGCQDELASIFQERRRPYPAVSISFFHMGIIRCTLSSTIKRFKQNCQVLSIHRLCQQVPSLDRCAKDSFSSAKEKCNMAFVKLSILRKLIPAYSSLLHTRRSKSKKWRSRNYISRGNPIAFIKYHHQKNKEIEVKVLVDRQC